MPLDTKKKQGCSSSGMITQPFFEDIATGFARPAIPVPELEKVYEAEHQARYVQPPFEARFASHDQKAREKQFSCFHGLSGFAAAPHEALKSSLKRFLIFDQSGNQTRLLRYALPLQYPSAVTRETAKLPDLHNVEKGFRNDNKIEDIDDDGIDGEESEMHEDTEEINALLYSDDDECESDDDLMSTGHSPLPIEKAFEEINSYDGPHKRQKLPDGGYCKSSLVDAESSTDNERSVKQEMGSSLNDEQSKKDKIRTAVKILESIVPGAKGKEALLLLDEAIDYLKILKQNVKPLGVNRC